MSFMDCYQQFSTTYAHADKANHAEIKATMQMKQTIKDDFLKLAKTTNNAILYTKFAQAPIPEQDAVDIGIKMLMSTGLFERQYEE